MSIHLLISLSFRSFCGVSRSGTHLLLDGLALHLLFQVDLVLRAQFSALLILQLLNLKQLRLSNSYAFSEHLRVRDLKRLDLSQNIYFERFVQHRQVL